MDEKQRSAWRMVRSIARKMPYTAPEIMHEHYIALERLATTMLSPVDNSAGAPEGSHSYGDLADQAQADDTTEPF